MKKLSIILLFGFVLTLFAQSTPIKPKDPKAKTPVSNCCDNTKKVDTCKTENCKDQNCCKDGEQKKEEVKKQDVNNKKQKKENKK